MNTRAMFNASSIISFLLNLLRVIFLLSAIGLILWGLYGLMDLLAGAPPITGGYPVFFSYLDEGVIKTADGQGIASIGMHKGMVEVSTEDLSNGFVLFRVLTGMAMHLSFLLAVYLTIRILESLQAGEYFAIANAVRLRWIALLSILITVLERIMVFRSCLYFENKLEFSGLAFKQIPFLRMEDLKFVIFFLFLLVIAEAFRAGALLKEESDLTI